MFDNLEQDCDAIIEVLQAAIASGEPVHMNDRIYSPEVRELYQEGSYRGKVYVLMDDTEHYIYLKNLQGVKDSLIAVSLPKNEIMISNKWKYTSRIYHAVNFNSPIKSRDGWARRYSHKGVEFFKVLKSQNYDICRFEVANSKHGLGCNEAYLERTPADCKALQTALKMKLGMEELPTNMLPVAQLEAILGAYTAGEAFFGNDAKKLFEYETLDVIGFEI